MFCKMPAISKKTSNMRSSWAERSQLLLFLTALMAQLVLLNAQFDGISNDDLSLLEENCTARLEEDDQMHIYCDIFTMSKFQATATQVIVISQHLITQRRPNSSRDFEHVRLAEVKIVKYDPGNIGQFYNREYFRLYDIVNMVLKDVDELEINITINSNITAGIVFLDKNCLERQRRPAPTYWHDDKGQNTVGCTNCSRQDDLKLVAECYNSVRLLKTVATPPETQELYHNPNFILDIILRNHSILENVVTILSDALNEIWIKRFNSTISEVKISANYIQSPLIKFLVKILSDGKIKKLSLPNNFNIRSIQASDFKGFTHLISLNLSGCQLASIEPDTFSELPNLKFLDLSRTQLKHLPYALKDARLLEELYINNLHLTFASGTKFTLDRNVTKELSSLRVLDLSNTLIEEDLYSIEALQNLETLRLSNSFKGDLPMAKFPDFPDLIYLDLSGNHFTKIPNLSMPSLKMIKLNANLLTAPLSFLKNNLTNLQILDLSNNDIVSWREPMLTNGVQLLNLSNNKLIDITDTMQSQLNLSHTVLLNNNPFDCGLCTLPKLQHWLKDVKLNFSAKVSSFVCRFPLSLEGSPLLVAELNQDCLPKKETWKLTVAIIFGSIGFLLVAGLVLAYIFRWKLQYLSAKLQSQLHNRYNKNQVHYKYDAYISVANEDLTWVYENLVPNLEETEPRFSTFIYERNAKGGKLILDDIAEKLDQCRKCILLLTSHFLADPWRRSELELALQKLFLNKRDMIILVCLNNDWADRPIPPKLQKLLSVKTYLVWPEDPTQRDAFWVKLKAASSLGIVWSETKNHFQRLP